MNKIAQKIMSTLLALLVLGSTTSFAVDKHFCGEHLIDIAFFGEATPCAMETALVEKYGPEHNKKSECCKDEIVIIQGQDEIKLQFDQLTIENLTFLQTFIHTYVDLFEGLERNFVPFEGYPPPLIVSDYQVLYDQYLI